MTIRLWPDEVALLEGLLYERLQGLPRPPEMEHPEANDEPLPVAPGGIYVGHHGKRRSR